MARIMLKLLAFTLGLGFLGFAAAAQQVDPASYSAMRWRMIGPHRGGRVTAVAGVAGHGETFYFGTPGGGIWKTTDGGRVWLPIFDAARVASIGALGVAPSNPNILYAGTGEQIAGNGVYRSDDAGKTWTNVGLRETHFITGVLIDPRDPDVVLVSATGDRQPGAARGVFKTTDGGKTWNKVLFRDERSGAVDISFAADTPNVVFASFQRGAIQLGGGQRLGRPEQNAFIYKSTDEGSSWQPVGAAGLPTEAMGRVGVAVAPGTRGMRIYLIAEQGFFRSDDGGQSWQASTTDPRVIGNGYFSRIFVDPNNADVLYVAQTSLYRSTDGGHTFEAYVGAPSGDDFHILWIDPLSAGAGKGGQRMPVSQRMILGVDQGAVISLDGGATWGSWYNQPTGQFYHVSTDNQFPYMIYAAQQDSGSVAVASRSNNGEITYRDWYSPAAFEVSYIAADPTNPDVIYNAGWYGSLQKVNRVTGDITQLFVRSEKYRSSVSPPLAFSPQDPHTLYMGAQIVLKTSNGGQDWQPVSGDLTIRPPSSEAPTPPARQGAPSNPATGAQPGAPAQVQPQPTAQQPAQPAPPPPPPNGTIVVLEPSRARAGEIWVGTSNGLVQVTRDAGKSWTNVTPPGLPPRGIGVSSIDPSPLDAATAYVVLNGFLATKPLVYRTHDFGQTWQAILATLPQEEIARAVRADTVRKGLLYAGTESDVFVSFDDGDHWQSLRLNLPTTSMRDLAVHENDLVLATFGRSLWVLDDLSPLRQADASANADRFLRPATATRVRWATYQDTPLPPETPTGENPPDGAILDYWLKAEPQGEITMTIRDAQGHEVRKFSSSTPQQKFPPANAPEYWFAPLPSLTAHTGHNRFVWNLRCDHPDALPYSYYGNLLDYIEYTLADHTIPGETPRYQPQGPLVPPGNYTVELSVNGQVLKQPLVIKEDPRVRIGQAALVAEFNLEHSTDLQMDASAQAFRQVGELAKAAAERKAALTTAHAGEDALKALDDLLEKIGDVAQGDERPNPRTNPAPNSAAANPVPGIGPINRELAHMAFNLDMSDGPPAAMVRASVEELCSALAKRLDEWRRLNTQSVPAVNAQLQKYSVPPLNAATPPATPACK